uniref:Uncharacterized protein n=1 Tax=Candidatus Kentrum sp. DK TaxID=2126562 RepID=A0A450TBA5_9GAMM|nr:MAG: hypothetical protein BECKDK2373C_GA0170839_111310 [Candidatus Kentron sp. DK]
MWIRYLGHPGRRGSGRRRCPVFKARSHLALPQDSLVGWAKAPLGTFVVDAELIRRRAHHGYVDGHVAALLCPSYKLPTMWIRYLSHPGGRGSGRRRCLGNKARSLSDLGVRREGKRDRDQNLCKFEANSELFNENLRGFWPISAFPQQNHPKSDRLLGVTSPSQEKGR